LYSQVARATGESLRTIRSQGFSLLTLAVPIEPPAPRLCLTCPGCGSEVALSDEEGELPEWAECPQCDIAYPYDDEEVFLPDDDRELVCA
jgi:peptide subunit release factor 1 (eRF1)